MRKTTRVKVYLAWELRVMSKGMAQTFEMTMRKAEMSAKEVAVLLV